MRKASRSLFLLSSRSQKLPLRYNSSSVRASLFVQRSQSNLTRKRLFHASQLAYISITPETDSPAPPKAEIAGGATHVGQPASITTEEYHRLSDEFIDALVALLEQMAEDPSSKLEIEYSVRRSLPSLRLTKAIFRLQSP